jgi:hypothetical protein
MNLFELVVAVLTIAGPCPSWMLRNHSKGRSPSLSVQFRAPWGFS